MFHLFTFWSDSVDLLPDPGDDGKVLREICREDSGDPVCVQIFKLAQFCKKYYMILGMKTISQIFLSMISHESNQLET